MRIGLAGSVIGERLGPEHVAGLARGAEERGFESLWMGEHVLEIEQQASRYPYTADGELPSMIDGGMAAPLITLAYAAACTSRIRLGTGVCVLTQRSPVYLAKDVASLDRLSGGRVDLGIGIGWQREELEACGVAWPGRGRRADEYVAILLRLWSGERTSFDGEFWTLPQCVQRPRPLQRPHPPLHVGGESDAALRRAVRLGQGWLGHLSVDALPERLQLLERLLAERGRAREDIEVSVVPLEPQIDVETIERLRDLGVDRVQLLAAGLGGDDLERGLDALAERIVVPARRL